MKKYLGIILLSVFLTEGFSQTLTQTQQIAQNDFQNYSVAEASRNYSGSYLPVFTAKENTVGSRYLFDKWVGGKIVNMMDAVISDDSTLFNYDKMDQKLLANLNNKKILEINTEAIKSFTLRNNGEEMVFEKVPIINDKDFFIEIVKNNNRYSLYKSLKTKFAKADYTTNGIFESGKKYDEFVDEFEYYIVFPGGKEFKKITLKRKSIKAALPGEDKKIRQYFSKDEEGIVNEPFLRGLVTFLNQ